MKLMQGALATVLAVVVCLARGEELALIPCTTAGEMETSVMLKLGADGDKKLTFNGERCLDPKEKCETGRYVRCVEEEDDGGYYNAHSYFTTKTDSAEEEEEEEDVATADGLLVSKDTTARLFGTSWFTSRTYYYKLPYGVDASESCSSNNIKCVSFYPNFDGLALAQASCDLLFFFCEGYGIYEPPNQNPFYCLKRKLGTSNFNEVKESSYPVKLFKRYTSSTLPRLYGFLSFPRTTKPSSTVALRTFSESSAYTEEDCAAMCESDDECNGYSLYEGNSSCASLMTISSTAGGVASTDGQIYFRQSGGSGDELSACELDESACPSAGVSGTVIGLSIAGTCAVLAAAFLVYHNRRRLRSNSLQSSETDAAVAVSAVDAEEAAGIQRSKAYV
ncbi:Hypothetical Protein FCC1311_104082 [Hondaea fermentalgiana]|uniref:Apple domain-containing protein n=1 Tax=Hondaea fermentalgiana TaxID=2315210 RepID=A0A2R5H1G4_9STRA|nr:Hypothetical Protein FCC1311_104082 [Hondaea fermentalgiana]|eukprot:GBG34184.1 Hypothetical Protein FCC1311_104082 [Hondaea fermentalgiana]